MNITLPPGVQALIFDMDGTLVHSKPAHIESWRRVMNSDGKQFTADDYNALNGRTSIGFAEGLRNSHGFSVAPNDAKAQKDEHYLNLLHCIALYHETMSIVEQYHSTLPIALGTNEAKPVTFKVLGALNIQHYFKAVVTSEDVARPKPFPDLFLECAKAMGVDPTACHVFEDSPVGIEAAAAAGMSCTDVTSLVKTTR